MLRVARCSAWWWVVVSACAEPAGYENGASVATRALDLLPLAECVSPLPEGPIWLDAAALEPALALEFVPDSHHLLQFRRSPSEADLKELSALGVQLLAPAPERAFWAYVAPQARVKELAITALAGGLARAVPAKAEHKLQPALSGEKPGTTQTAAVHWFSDADPQLRAELGGKKLKRRQRIGSTDVVVGPVEELRALAGLDSVQFIEAYTTSFVPHSHAGQVAHHAGALYEAPHEISGAGMSVAVFDFGWVDADHPDFVGRVTFDPDLLTWRGTPFRGSSMDVERPHSTHMAGIIAASGAGNAAARGTVPEVNVVSYWFAYEYFEPDELVASQSELYGWRVSNHSYGRGHPCGPPNVEPCKSDLRWSSYIPDARSADLWAAEHGVLSVFSAGNDGLQKEDRTPEFLHDNWQTIHSGGVAKNAISVCAAAPTEGGPFEFSVKLDSAKGPTSDGRVKPDLCALGARLPSEPTLTTELGGGYVQTYATSPASAEVAGAAVALHEQYARMFPDDPDIPPALAKGLLLHTARDMDENTARWLGTTGEYATAHTQFGPDYTTGWGFMDLGAAFNALVERDFRVNTLAATEQDDYTLGGVAPGTEIKITLIWDDPPGTPGISRTLVNDLDLRVTNLTTGEVTYPFVTHMLDPTFGATRGVNFKDNVEQVRFVYEGARYADFLIEVLPRYFSTRAQRYFLLFDQPVARASRVIDEHRLRRIVEANAVRELSCAGVFLRGPLLELSRRLIVTLPGQKDPVVSPFTPLETSAELHVAPLGAVDQATADRWKDLHGKLLEAGDSGVVLLQERSQKGGQRLAVQRRSVAKTERLELALEDLELR